MKRLHIAFHVSCCLAHATSKLLSSHRERLTWIQNQTSILYSATNHWWEDIPSQNIHISHSSPHPASTGSAEGWKLHYSQPCPVAKEDRVGVSSITWKASQRKPEAPGGTLAPRTLPAAQRRQGWPGTASPKAPGAPKGQHRHCCDIPGIIHTLFSCQTGWKGSLLFPGRCSTMAKLENTGKFRHMAPQSAGFIVCRAGSPMPSHTSVPGINLLW